MYRILICVILFAVCYSSNNIAYNIPDPECTGIFNLCTDVDKERLGREAIKAIHEQMDDDKDGKIEASEGSEFIQEELESKTDSFRHRHFQNANLQITYNDLWSQWQKSAVYNWTTDNVVDWLVNYVNLPMYVDNFRRNQFDGRMIPRLATNERHYLSAIMQIRDTRHKRRLVIKATDVILFGPPPSTHNLVKDMILMSLVLLSLGACLYAFLRHRKTQESMMIMMKELETLQKAEGDLVAVTGKMKAMEYELKDKPKVDRGLLNSWFLEVQKTKDEAEKYRKRRDSTFDHDKQLRLAVQEIEQLRIALRKAEEHAQHQSFEPPSELIDLLRRTYLIEETAFEIKRKAAENAMLTAKEQMTKISKMQRGFFGAVRIAHTGCIDDISELINSAKERLSEVHDEHEERERRWNRISSLLDREDLISCSSSSSASAACNQYLAGSPNASLNNGLNPNTIVGDVCLRPKQQPSLDSNHLVNTSIDSGSIRKSNSNLNIRSALPNPTISIQSAGRDLFLRSDTGSDYSNSPSTVKRRTFTNSTLLSNHTQLDRLSLNRKMVYSHSTNGLNDSTESNRPNAYDSIELLSNSQPSKPIFDIITDSQLDNTDSLLDDQERKSHRSGSINSDQQSVLSPGKKRKPLFSTKLLKPFQSMRSRKKSNNS